MAFRSAPIAIVFAYVISGLNPFGGPLIAVPLAIFKLAWPPWLAVLLTIPLAYTQVVVVDLCWDRLLAWPRARNFLEKRRSPRLESMLARRDSALWLSILSPWIGCWLCIAAARFGGYRHAKVALPLLVGLTYAVALIATLCVLAPEWLPE